MKTLSSPKPKLEIARQNAFKLEIKKRKPELLQLITKFNKETNTIPKPNPYPIEISTC